MKDNRDRDRDRERERERERGVKREGEETNTSSSISAGSKKMKQQGFPPQLQHKLAGQKTWPRQEETKTDREEGGKTVSFNIALVHYFLF